MADRQINRDGQAADGRRGAKTNLTLKATEHPWRVTYLQVIRMQILAGSFSACNP